MSGRFAVFDERAGGEPSLDVRVELAREDTLDDIARLHAGREGVPFEQARARWQRQWDRRNTPLAKTTFVARTDERVVGYGSLQHLGASAPPDGRAECPAGWYLAGLVVEERARRRGVGTRLVRRRLAWLAERGETECFYVANEHNGATIALHAELGFTLMARDVWLPRVTFEGGAGLLFRRAL